MRIVVTGLGAVTPLGIEPQYAFSQLLKGVSGAIKTPSDPLYSQIPSKVVCSVPQGLQNHQFDAQRLLGPEARRLARFSQFAAISADQALADANYHPSEKQALETGVSIGLCIGGLYDLVDSSTSLLEKGYRKISPLFIPRYLNNMAAGAVAMRTPARAFSNTVSTACATGLSAIGDAYNLLKNGAAKVVIAGASEAAIHPVALAGFARSRLVTCADVAPEKASRPFDKNRSGFVLGEGAGVVILEELDHALARNAKIYCEVVGYGFSSDAYHITAPSPNGEGAARAMEMALKSAGLVTFSERRKVSYVNAHATSTKLGDAAENAAIRTVFGDRGTSLVVGSNKGAIGHLLGAAGAVEAIFTILAMQHGKIPKTLNCEEPGDDDLGWDFDYAVSNVLKEIEYAVSNSFGFGGVNASLVFKQYR